MSLFKIKKALKKIIPSYVISWYHFLLAFFGALIYGFPSQRGRLKVIGVTGTNGKTTVVEMISRILEEAGYGVAFISSVKFKIKDNEEKNTLRMTMPGRFTIQRFLRKALNANCEYVIVEVTSEGIKQHRHRFISFDVAVLTNLAPEHIESHGSFEAYKKAKAQLFKVTEGVHVINLDDKHSDFFLKIPSYHKYLYTMEKHKIDSARKETPVVFGSILPSPQKRGISFWVKNVAFNIKLLGKFNVYNCLAAIGVALSQEVELETCKRALEEMEGIPGRMEKVISQPFKVVVDYAFTPQALEKVYQDLKESFSPPRMICVLGACGGGRDKWKRPVLGELASRHCQKVIITNEDPFDEDPMEIIEEVSEGSQGEPEKIIDRRKAIRKALQEAQEGDVVVITGKGCENSICVEGGKRIPWDDRKVVREEFDKIKKE